MDGAIETSFVDIFVLGSIAREFAVSIVVESDGSPPSATLDVVPTDSDDVSVTEIIAVAVVDVVVS
jgi:hypothetical protein